MLRSLLLATLLLGSSPALAGDWSFLGTRDGVSTWSREVSDTRLLGFRGESVVNERANKLVGAMLDPSKTTQWVDLLAESRIIERRGGTTILYQRYGLAWPVADRDMVLEQTVRVYPEKHLTTILITSTTHPDVPDVAGVVRAEVERTYFAFTALPDGTTKVEVEAFSDPRGIVPAWMINLVQKTWARNSIQALTGLAGRKDVTPYPNVPSY